ncbi:MAG: hypothetical protein WCI93_02420 [bacterium]
MKEQIPKNENGITPTNQELAYLKKQLLVKQLADCKKESDNVTALENFLWNDYQEKEKELKGKFPDLEKEKGNAESDASNAWTTYYGYLNDSTLGTQEEKTLFHQIYLTKQEISNNLNSQLNDLLNTNFPKELEAFDIAKNSWLLEHKRIYDENLFSKIWEKREELSDSLYKSKKLYYELEGVNYENGVNAFLENVRTHQEKRQQQLDQRLTDGLRALGELSPTNIESGKKLFKKEIFIMEGLARKWRQYTIRTAVWAFSIFALSYGMKEVGEIKTQSYLNPKIDSLYNIVNTTPHDSITDVIFHGIANDKELPEQWKKFIAKEDSAEISNSDIVDRELYGKDGILTPEKSEQEKKLDYITLWQMNEKHGAPKVQYGGQGKGLWRDRASYYNSENMANLPTHFGSFVLDDYLAELSHAEQFAKNPEKYHTWFEKDVDNTRSIASAKKISYDDAQLETYDNKNTVEYEAHKIIQPKLEDEFEKTKENIKENLLNPKK